MQPSPITLAGKLPVPRFGGTVLGSRFPEEGLSDMVFEATKIPVMSEALPGPHGHVGAMAR